MAAAEKKASGESVPEKAPIIAAVPKKNKKIGLLPKVAAIAAACVLATGVAGVIAGAYGTGPMADLFSKKASIEEETAESNDPTVVTDRKSAEIAKEGYLLYIGETQSLDGYHVTLEGVTGDDANPQIMFTIKVDDPDFVATHDSFDCTLFPSLGEEAYAQRWDGELVDFQDGHYPYDRATAVQDKEDPSTYYLSARGYPSWLSGGKSVVTELRSIYLDANSEKMLHLVYRYTMPDDGSALKRTTDIYTESSQMAKGPNGVDYEPFHYEFGEYEICVYVRFNIRGTDYEYLIDHYQEEYNSHCDQIEEALTQPLLEMKLVAGDQEYCPTTCSRIPETSDGEFCVGVTFPFVDVSGIDVVEVELFGEVFEVKLPDKEPI